MLIAYKLLVDWVKEKRSKWAVSLEWEERRMGAVEESFLEALHHNVWIRYGAFLQLSGRMDMLREEVPEKQSMEQHPTPLDFVLRRFGKR